MSSNWKNKANFFKGIHDLSSCRGYGIILASCDTNRDREGSKELHNLVSQTIEKLYAKEIKELKEQSSNSNNSTSSSEAPSTSLSISDLIKQEVQEIKSTQLQFVASVTTGIKGIVVVKLLKKIFCPIKIVQEIFADVKRQKQLNSRYLIRLIPLKRVCYPNGKEVSDNLMRHIYRNLADEGIISEEDVPTKPIHPESDSEDEVEEEEPEKEEQNEEEKKEEKKEEEKKEEKEEDEKEEEEEKEETEDKEPSLKRSRKDTSLPPELTEERRQELIKEREERKRLKEIEKEKKRKIDEKNKKKNFRYLDPLYFENFNYPKIIIGGDGTGEKYEKLLYKLEFKTRNHNIIGKNLILPYLLKLLEPYAQGEYKHPKYVLYVEVVKNVCGMSWIRLDDFDGENFTDFNLRKYFDKVSSEEN